MGLMAGLRRPHADQANLRRMKTTKPMSASASVKAMPKNMLTMMRGNIGELDHFEGLFCAFERSNCITEIIECICETCDVFKEHDLPNYGYCTTTGGEKSHMG